jgi:drug/metabolite transporter (DMT)-like permease
MMAYGSRSGVWVQKKGITGTVFFVGRSTVCVGGWGIFRQFMSTVQKRPASTGMVVVAFAIVYIVWGSTYFFIRLSIEHIPPMMLGALRFFIAGVLMLLWCLARGEQLFVWQHIRPAIVSGLLLLFTGTGVLIWSEQYLTTSLAAILLASSPIWFVVLDKRNWSVNFRSKETIIGLLVGFAGVILLFGERLWRSVNNAGGAGDGGAIGGRHGAYGEQGARPGQVLVMIILLLGAVSWAAGSLYAKYKSTGKSNSVNAGWQMLAAGMAFIPASLIRGETHGFHWADVSLSSWLSLIYLVTFGSLAGYSAFVWLLQVRSATLVSTHAYVNPVVAVLLGTLFAGETMTTMQLLGLAIILVSVLLINLAKYRKTGPGLTSGQKAVSGTV